jgi:Protein of unknown function (DUF4239)
LNETLVTLLQAVIIIGGMLLLAELGFVLVHRRIGVHTRHAHNDVAGFIYAVVGIMYAILLAYVTIIVWERFDSANSVVEQEATNAYNIYHEVDEFPDSNRSEVEGIVKAYVETTVHDEWPLLASGKYSQQAEDLADQLGSAVARLPVTSPAQQVLMDHIMTQYESVLSERHLRLFEATAGVHPLLWILLLGGAVATIGFTYFFGIENAWAHAAMIAALTFVIAATLFVIVQVNDPFAGAVSVSSEPLEKVLATFTGA